MSSLLLSLSVSLSMCLCASLSLSLAHSPPPSPFLLQVSLDKEHWVMVVDRSDHLCRSWQELFFEPTVVRSALYLCKGTISNSVCVCVCRYIRVVGVYNSMNRSFHLVSFACLYTFKPFKLTNRDIIGEPHSPTPTHFSLSLSLSPSSPSGECGQYSSQCNSAGWGEQK